MNHPFRALALLSAMVALAVQTVCAATDESDQDLNPPPPGEGTEEQVVETVQADPGSGDEGAAPAEGGSVGRERSSTASGEAGFNRSKPALPSDSKARDRSRTEPETPNRRDRRPTTRLEDRARSTLRRDRSPGEKEKSAPLSKPGTSVAKRDYAAFKLITERNIFNANRSARTARSGGEGRRSPTAAPETVTLVGTLSSEKGFYAFFDGSKSEFRKVLELGKGIADHRVIGISNATVRLQGGTNAFDLQVGGQLQREEEGWRIVETGLPHAEPKVGAWGPSDSSSSAESDVVKRLMEQREKELR